MNDSYKNQNSWYIKTSDHNLKFPAEIHSQEQREKIQELINQGYIPTHTSPGKAKCSKKHWNLEVYHGRYGDGYRMISQYPKSHNFNSITYFIKQAI